MHKTRESEEERTIVVSNKARERREAIAKLEVERKARERRRTIATASIAVVIVIAIVVATWVGLKQVADDREATAQAAEGPVDGVQTFEDLTRNHVDGEVGYDQAPGVGGDHNPVWVDCGAYEEPVFEPSAVHSLEHGAVWVTYQPDLPADQVQILKDLAAADEYTLVTPYPDQESPVVASAWGVQLALDSADDSRLDTFLAKYLQGEQTPEPGAPCTGGSSGM